MLQRRSAANSPGGATKNGRNNLHGSSSSSLSTSLSKSSNKFQYLLQPSFSWFSLGLVVLVGGFAFLAFSMQRDYTLILWRQTTTTRTRTSSASTTNLRKHKSSSNMIPNFEPIHQECTVWMAPSSLKGFAGYGTFTTRDLAQEESILGTADGVAIPVETKWDKHSSPKLDERKAWWNIWGNYVWGRGLPDHASYYAISGRVMDFQIGFGALPNHHCILNSLSYKYPIPPYDDRLVDRFRDPGAGAFTYSRGRQFIVKRALTAGSEIFLNYGYCSHGGHEPEWVDNTYVTGDYEEAASRIWNTIKGSTEGEEEDDDDNEYAMLKFNALGNLFPPDTSRLVRELLPQTHEELEAIKEKVESKDDITWYLATHKSIIPRTPEWIRENGMCLENLRPMPSTLPQAGQGAFAQYAIAKDEIVIPAPSLQVMDTDVLKVYQDGNNFLGHQLLLNYCFGHRDSSLLLCPATQAELINHCSTRTRECGNQGPNAAIRWAQGWDPVSDKWQTYSYEQLDKETSRGLALEVYALRDIAPGEEVFIDYGIEWEQAWQKHMETYRPPQQVGGWITAKEANAKDKILPQFITQDLRRTVNHPYLFTACQYFASSVDENEYPPDDEHQEISNNEWKDWSDEKILQVFSDTGTKFIYKDKYGRTDQGYSRHRDKSHWPCSVLREEEGEGMDAMGNPTTFYTVRIHQSPFKDETSWHESDLPRILTNYSRSSIHYIVQSYAGDQFIPGAFRHAIGIPDEMFPEQWKNLLAGKH